jgi:hypothetical protein
MSKPAFIGRFLLVFAALIVLGWATDGPRRYAGALRAAAGTVTPAVSGWWIEQRTVGGKEETFFRRGEHELKLLLSLEALALGLLPLLSLLGATPGLGWRRLAPRMAIGIAGLFLLDLVVLVLYPYLVSQTSFADALGTFLGILTFVGGPVILWFVLTFDRLRGVWRLDVRTDGDLTTRGNGRQAGRRSRADG